MMNQKCIKENEILLIKGDKNYKLTFELQNKNESMVIKAEEKNEKVLIPYTYKKVLTTKEWLKKERDIEIKINNMEVVLKKIIASSKNNKLEFEIEDKKYIKLYYYFLEGEREEIYLPVAYKTEDPQTIYTLSSLLLQNTKLLNHIFKYIKTLKINIKHANAFNIKLKNKENFHKNLLDNQTHEIKNIINDLKNYIQTSNEQQNEKISSIKNLFKQKSEENTKKISDLNSEVNSKLNTQISSINNLFKQQSEENAKHFSDLNSKLTNQANSIQQEDESDDGQIKELNGEVSEVPYIHRFESEDDDEYMFHRFGFEDTLHRPKKMNIFIMSLTGYKFELNVEPSDTVLELKKKIEVKEKLPLDHTRIIYRGKTLENNRTLFEYDVGYGDTLHLVIRLTGNKGWIEKENKEIKKYF